MSTSSKSFVVRLLLICLLGALPSVVYWDSLWMRFGFRDDYSTLREAHEEPGKLFAFCAGQGRPLYGILVEETFEELKGIDQLPFARLAGALSIGVVCVGIAWILESRQGWPRYLAVSCGIMLGLLPSAQVVIDWGSCWPHAFAAALGVVAFSLTDIGLSSDGSALRRVALVSAGTGLLFAGLLTYQPDALLYVVPMSAGFLAMKGSRLQERFRWLARHVFVIGLALVSAFAVIKILFALKVVVPSARVVVEGNILGKLQWFMREPLDNAFALFLLENKHGSDNTLHWMAAWAVGIFILLGGVIEYKRSGWFAGILWLGSVVGLCLTAYVVSLVAAERWATYRTLYAMTGVVVIFLMRTLWLIAEDRRRLLRMVSHTLVGSLLLLGVVQAAHNTQDDIGEPQSEELAQLSRQAGRIDPVKGPRVFVILANPADTRSELRYLDEFGSVSADSEWCTKEMLLQVLRDRFPEESDLPNRVRLSFGRNEPAPGLYDAVIDMRVPPEPPPPPAQSSGSDSLGSGVS